MSIFTFTKKSFSVLAILFAFVTLTQAQTYTTSGSWVCPAGVTSVTVQCWGGGGGGGGTSVKKPCRYTVNYLLHTAL